jgi:GTP cyclohydrolase I
VHGAIVTHGEHGRIGNGRPDGSSHAHASTMASLMAGSELERLADRIATTIMDTIDPHGVGVEARHPSVMMCGVQKQSSMLMTSAVLGTSRSSHPTRAALLALLERRP